MPRPRRNCRRDSFSSGQSDVDYVPILDLPDECGSRRKRTNRQTTKRRETTRKTNPKMPRHDNSVIILDDSDEDCFSTVISRSRTINENVMNRVEEVFKSSGLLSDDEDEPVVMNRNNREHCNILTNLDEPSSSTKRDIEPIMVEDDLNEIRTLEDIKNYCDETEDILKNAKAILQKFSETSSPVEEQPIAKEISENKEKENGNQEKRLECPICYENLSEKQVMTTKCGHLFCKTCIERVATTIKKCPTCRKAVNKKNIIPIYI